MLLGAHAHQLAIRGDYVCLPHARGVEAILASEPSEAAAHRIADDADVGGGAKEAGQAVHLGLVHQVEPQRAGLDPRRPIHGVYPDASHVGGIDQDPTVARRAHPVARRHHPDAESPFAGETHGGHHVGSTAGHDHERGLLVGGQIPRPARVFVALLARRVRTAAQAGPQGL